MITNTRNIILPIENEEFLQDFDVKQLEIV